jgi:hypothetical protein
VHAAQTAVPGRRIDDSVRTLLDTPAYCAKAGIDAWHLVLDQEKAFDRVAWPYLAEVLRAYGFGPAFRSAIRTLYQGLTAQLCVNGALSRPFAVGRGVRQGDPLSPLLYVLCLDPLVRRIQGHPGIRGIPLPVVPGLPADACAAAA